MTDPEDEVRDLAAALAGQTWEVDLPPDDLPPPEPETPPAEPMPAAPPAPAAAVPEPDRPPPPERIVEALLFVGGPPLTAARAAELVRGLTPGQFAESLDSLERTWRRQNRPYGVVVTPAGASLALRPAFRPLRERLAGGPREARLSPQALDVLSLVAYRQPVTRAEVDNARGSDSAAVLRQLVRLGLVALAPRGDGSTEVHYNTTARFLELFRIASLDDLPRAGDLQRL